MVDVVLADPQVVDDSHDFVTLERAATALGGRLVMAPVAADDGSPRHDPVRLAAAYADLFSGPMAAGQVGETRTRPLEGEDKP